MKPKALPLAAWPDADRTGWLLACTPARRFARGGLASGMKPSTQAAAARAYGYFLDHCHRISLLDPAAAAAGHVHPSSVDSFLTELSQRVGSVTRLSYLQRILRVAAILDPGRDVAWLADRVADLRDGARPRPKYPRIVDSDRLLALGLDFIRRAEASDDRAPLECARLYRNGLMVALLAVCPIRLANFHALTIGRQIRLIDDGWWICLDAEETKSRRPDERPIPEIVACHIPRWLAHWRPHFRSPADHFWPSTKGGRLAYTFVGAIVTETTRAAFGIAVNPHLFRDCAVHTIATVDGRRMHEASALLQHADARVTEAHYNKGAMVYAAKRYAALVKAWGHKPVR